MPFFIVIKKKIFTVLWVTAFFEEVKKIVKEKTLAQEKQDVYFSSKTSLFLSFFTCFKNLKNGTAPHYHDFKNNLKFFRNRK